VSGRPYDPADIPPPKESPHPLSRRLGGPRAGLDILERSESFVSVGIRIPDGPSCSLLGARVCARAEVKLRFQGRLLSLDRKMSQV
jgi:hypothetical protein